MGSKKAIEGIQNLRDSSIKHIAATNLAHSLAKAAEEGTKALAKTSARTLSTSLDRILPPVHPPTLSPQPGAQSQPAKPRKPKHPSSKVRKRPASAHLKRPAAPKKRCRNIDKNISRWSVRCAIVLLPKRKTSINIQRFIQSTDPSSVLLVTRDFIARNTKTDTKSFTQFLLPDRRG